MAAITIKKSNSLNGSVANSPATLAYGELAMNYKAGYESLFMKNDAGTIIALNSWAHILNKPTTLSGYGITDAATSTHVHTFASLTSKPTTLSGYGIVDALSNLTGNLYTDRLTEKEYIKGNTSKTLRPLFDVLRADRTVFLPADQIIIEQSTDAGVTWTDAGYSDDAKKKIFTGHRPTITIPLKGGVKNCDCMVRITITGMKYNVPVSTPEIDKYNYWNSTYVSSSERYCTLSEGYTWLNSNSDSIYMKAERATGAASTTWVTDREAYMSGGSGGNGFSLSNSVFGGGTTQTSNYWNWRFTFRTCTNTNTFVNAALSASGTTSQQSINHIKLSGPNCWTSPNSLMSIDHLYSWDVDKNAIFPNGVNSTRFYTGYDSGVANSMSCSNWFRSNGATGWMNTTYGGGFYCDDTTWVKVYNNKGIYTAGNLLIGGTGNFNGSQLVLRGNSIESHSTNGASELSINYYGYNGGSTQYRNLAVYNGKCGINTFFDGVNGRVGIGTISPDHTLDVRGVGRFTGALYANNTLSVNNTIDCKSLDLLGLSSVAAGVASTGIRFSGNGIAHANIVWKPNERTFEFHTSNGTDGLDDSYGAANLSLNGNITAHSFIGNAATASQLSGSLPLIASATENNPIAVIDDGNGAITVNSPNAGMAAIRHGFSFKWYSDDYHFGIIRGVGSESQGLGITQNSSNLLWKARASDISHYVPTYTQALTVQGELTTTKNICLSNSSENSLYSNGYQISLIKYSADWVTKSRLTLTDNGINITSDFVDVYGSLRNFGSLAVSESITTNQYNLGSWSVVESNEGELLFKKEGVTLVKLTSNGLVSLKGLSSLGPV